MGRSTEITGLKGRERLAEALREQSYPVLCLCWGGVGLVLSMARILWGIPLFWFVLPGYALALGLSFVVPPIFTGIAFDSGGVASGPMTATFLLPFAMGACEALGGDILSDAFGIVALVAMTPLVTIQLLGLWSQMRAKTGAIFPAPKPELDDIIEYEPVEV